MPRLLLLALFALIAAACAPSQPAEPPVAPAAPPAVSSPAPTPRPAATPVPPTATPAPRQVADVEFKWSTDPSLLENEGLPMAFQAQQIPGVTHADITETGMIVQYDPAQLDVARLRSELRSRGVPIAD